MKTFAIALLATSFSAIATSAFADSDTASRDEFLRTLTAQAAAHMVVEGRQAVRANPVPSANDQLLIDLAVERNASRH